MIIQHSVDKDSLEYLSKRKCDKNIPTYQFIKIMAFITAVFFCTTCIDAADRDVRAQEKKDNGKTCAVDIL